MRYFGCVCLGVVLVHQWRKCSQRCTQGGALQEETDWMRQDILQPNAEERLCLQTPCLY